MTATLAVAREPERRDWRRISAAGITAVVDLRAEAEDVSRLALARGIEYLRLPIEEHSAPSEAELQRVTDWICERLAAGRTVLVHCRAGMGRSPLVACAALVQHGMSLPAAYEVLKQARPQAFLNEVQDTMLRSFAGRYSADAESNLPGREGAAGDT